MGYINFALDIPQLPQCIVNDPDNWIGHWTDSNYWNDTWFDFDGVDKSVVSEGVLLSDSTCSFKLYAKNQYGIGLGLYKGSETSPRWAQEMRIGDTRQDLRIGYICLVNTDTGKAHFTLVGEFTWRPTGAVSYSYPAGSAASTYKSNQWLTADDDVYTLITNNPLLLYNWQSVQSISGKNKTVSLTTLKEESINDGSPVDDATASAFNNAPNSCSVGGIVSVDLPIVGDNPLTIAVKYNIPELTDSVYSSCKVVAKKNKIPKSKTDGDKILDVSPSSHSCVIRGLEQETKYYVVVFVEDSFGNKAESEPGGPVRTGKQDGIFKIRITTMQGAKDGDFKENIEVTRV